MGAQNASGVPPCICALYNQVSEPGTHPTLRNCTPQSQGCAEGALQVGVQFQVL